MVSVEEIVKGIAQLRKELTDLLKTSPPEEGLLSAKLNRWANRAHTQLTDWGLPQDANLFSGARYRAMADDWQGNLYRQAKAKDEILKALQDDMTAHPEHY